MKTECQRTSSVNTKTKQLDSSLVVNQMVSVIPRSYCFFNFLFRGNANRIRYCQPYSVNSSALGISLHT